MDRPLEEREFLKSFRDNKIASVDFERKMLECVSLLDLNLRTKINKELIYEDNAGHVLMMTQCSLEKLVVLYIGSVKGGIPIVLSAHGHTVVVCSLDDDLLYFFQNRVKSLEINTIHCLKSTLDNLPFRGNSFDLILIETDSFLKNGVSDDFECFELEEILRSSKKSLRPGGQCSLLVGNVFYYRRLLEYYAKSVNVKGKRMLPANKIVRMLKGAGFSNILTYRVDPETGAFEYESKFLTGQKFTTSVSLKRMGWKNHAKSLLLKTLSKSFAGAPSYGFVASRNNKPSALKEIIENTLEKIRSNNFLGLKNPVVHSVLNRKAERIMIRVVDEFNPRESAFIKIPYGAWAKKTEKTAYASLGKVHSHPRISDSIKKKVPYPIFHVSECGFDVYVESYISNAVPPNGEDRNDILPAAFDFIFSLQCQTIVWEKISGDTYFRLVKKPLYAVEKLCYKLEHFKLLNDLRGYVQKVLLNRTIPLVFVHGDYSLTNLLVYGNKRGLAGVVDWELSDTKGLPAVDLFFLLFNTDENGINSHCEILRLLLDNRGKDIGNYSILQKYLRITGLRSDLLPALIILHWATQVASRGFPMRKKFNHNWLEENIYKFIYYSCEAFARSGI